MMEAIGNISFNNITLHNAPLSDIPWYIALVISVFGAVGNTLVCAAIVVDKNLQTNTNYFLFSLSIADLLVCVLVIPTRIILNVYDLQPSMFPLCVFYLVGDNCLTAASPLHICSISIERYYAIKDPLGATKMTKGKLLRRISLVWAISFLTIVPYLISALLSEYPQKTSYCVTVMNHFPYFQMVLFTEAFVIYVMVAVVLYTFIRTVMILYRLVQQQNDPGNIVRSIANSQDIKGSNSNLRALNTEKRALRVVWIISFAFIVTLVPYAICNTIYIFFHIHVAAEITKTVAYLNYINSVINPILYTVFNEQFRKNFANFIMLKFGSRAVSQGNVISICLR
ncbi:5-hydroxytryptamine receptor 2B-like [Euwallacea fornicatus]|uniref:5-hydroxytryptamine receptor 2B-like n=1 Tax=Euwallacea fornicatus TaxID=995702 RepID=UPI00339006CC